MVGSAYCFVAVDCFPECVVEVACLFAVSAFSGLDGSDAGVAFYCHALPLGFEPSLPESKSGMLPLHYGRFVLDGDAGYYSAFSDSAFVDVDNAVGVWIGYHDVEGSYVPASYFWHLFNEFDDAVDEVVEM